MYTYIHCGQGKKSMSNARMRPLLGGSTPVGDDHPLHADCNEVWVERLTAHIQQKASFQNPSA